MLLSYCMRAPSRALSVEHEQVGAAQAEKLVAKGATLLDVRPTYQFERERVAGAVSVPMFRKVAGSGPWDNAKKLVMRFGLAMEATGAGPRASGLLQRLSLGRLMDGKSSELQQVNVRQTVTCR